MRWRKTTDDKPEPNKRILILEDTGRICEGYMSKSVWAGEDRPTYGFHGRYYDFVKNEDTHCLVNAWGWMELPEKPVWSRD